MDHSKGRDISASMHLIYVHRSNVTVDMSQGLVIRDMSQGLNKIDKARLEFVVDLVLRQSMAESGLVVSHGGVGEPTQCSEGEYRRTALGESALLDPHGASGDLSHGLPWMQG